MKNLKPIDLIMEKFQNKYRIPSARFSYWDYGSDGAYFITICTHNRIQYFGDIVDGKMILNELGLLAEKFWHEIPARFPYIQLGNFVVMPNHVHGILIIDKSSVVFVETRLIASQQTRLIASLPAPPAPQKTGGITGANNPMCHDNISRIIRWFKGRTTFEIRKIHIDFAWQSRFHDHVIRGKPSFERIQNYIENNPMNWDKDKFYE